MSEQEVHEIQLNGKQLVFMFGAAVVVSVVIFLCGVMVGRGVRQPHGELLAASAADTPLESPDPLEAAVARPEVPVEPVPAPEREDVTYGKRLEAAVPLDEPLEPVQAPKPAVTPAVAEKPAAPPEPASNTRFAEPPGNGYVVQVGAYPTRADAEAQAGRLGTKGYPTFITLNNDVPRGRYRVRVGKYPNKRDAEAIALRLRQEERLDPWVP
jgi:cell division protein FtsN